MYNFSLPNNVTYDLPHDETLPYPTSLPYDLGCNYT